MKSKPTVSEGKLIILDKNYFKEGGRGGFNNKFKNVISILPTSNLISLDWHRVIRAFTQTSKRT